MAVDKLVLCKNRTENSVVPFIQIGVAHQTQLAETIHALQCNATCPYQMRHCSRSLGPDGLDCANHINLSFCLQLLNKTPDSYECTSAAETVTASGKDIMKAVI